MKILKNTKRFPTFSRFQEHRVASVAPSRAHYITRGKAGASLAEPASPVIAQNMSPTLQTFHDFVIISFKHKCLPSGAGPSFNTFGRYMWSTSLRRPC